MVLEKCLLPNSGNSLPWEDASDIFYVESGRQALAIAEEELRTRGHSQIHVPSYLCDSMIQPFQTAGWTLVELPVDVDLGVSPADLLSRVTTGSLLHAPYFGRQDSPEVLDALEVLRRRGVAVIADETHRVFSRPSSAVDIRVASLRKSLPLYDGGYVTGASRLLRPDPQTQPQGPAALRERAMRVKTDSLASGADNKAHRNLFAMAERAAESRTRPSPMSDTSMSLLGRLNVNLIGAIRLTNSITLNEALGRSDRFRVINPPADDLLPFCLVLETADPPRLQQHLAGQRIYCPIHWPPSELLPHTRNWPDRYISLPIDHRYGERDMHRMAACIRDYFA